MLSAPNQTICPSGFGILRIPLCLRSLTGKRESGPALALRGVAELSVLGDMESGAFRSMDRNGMSSLSSVNARTKTVIATIVLAFVCAWPAGNAWAKDSLDVSVVSVVPAAKAGDAPVIVNNGQAVGTIQLFYTVNASAFSPGPFATFDVNWVTSADSKKATDYGSGVTFTLKQDQQGGYVDFSASPDSFTLTAAGQKDVSRVTVYISPDKAGKLPPTADGTVLVGNLKLDAGKDVGTVTNIQVHILLVHPTDCLKVYNFVTDQDFEMGILDTTSLKVPTKGGQAGKVVSSQPAQFSDSVLVVNTCGTAQSFDLSIGLDSSFSTNPNGNPGNAVFAYTADGEFDTTGFDITAFAGKTPYQQNLCLQNVTVEAGTSFLATVHSKVRDGWAQTALPTAASIDFAASLYQNVNSACTGALHSLVSPNPAAFSLPFTIKAN